MILRLLLLVLACNSVTQALESTPPNPSSPAAKNAAPPVKPAMNRLVEHLIVMPKGKLHEALLSTTITPKNLHFAPSLLHPTRSRAHVSLMEETGHSTAFSTDLSKAVKASAQRAPINEWLRNYRTGVAIAPDPSFFIGSDFSEGTNIPIITRDINAIMIDANAMIN